jgi:hypothetical protein
MATPSPSYFPILIGTGSLPRRGEESGREGDGTSPDKRDEFGEGKIPSVSSPVNSPGSQP